MNEEPAPVVITVTGDAETRRAPEQGAVAVTVSAESAERASAVESALALHERLSGQLHALAEDRPSPLAGWSADRMHVSATRPWNQDGRQLPLVYRAAAGLRAVFTDFTRLGEWIGEVSLVEGVAVDGLDWSLDEATLESVTNEVRRAAVDDAVAKARVYAERLGLGVVVPRALADRGLLDAPAPPQPVAMRAVRMTAMSADTAGPSLAFEPEELLVRASVEARFEARAEPR